MLLHGSAHLRRVTRRCASRLNEYMLCNTGSFGSRFMESTSFHGVSFGPAPQHYAPHDNSTQGTTMSTVAQPYLPERPIAVGNRQSATTGSDPRLFSARRITDQRILTFPSLAGSFGSQLVVGNCQPLSGSAAPRRARLRNTAQHISTNTKPSSDRIRAVIGGLVLLLCRSTLLAIPRCVAPLLNATNYHSRRK